MLPAAVVQPRAAHSATVIFLHGLGDSGHGWSDVGNMLAPRLPWVKFIFPHAPSIPVTLNMGMRMPAWYDIRSLDGSDAREDREGLERSRNAVAELINHEAALLGGRTNRILLGGFSQGSAVSLFTAATSQLDLGGFVCLSGYLPVQFQLGKGIAVTEINKRKRIFMGHGTADEVVKFAWGRASAEWLKCAGFDNLEFKPYPGMGHSSCHEEIEDVADFISNVVPKQ